MLNLFTYEAIRLIDEERRTRSLARYEMLYRLRPRREKTAAKRGDEADVVELAFPAECQAPEQLGA